MSAKGHLVELQDTLYNSRNPTRRWLHCIRRDWIIGALNQLALEPSGRALEVGPGSGVYLPVLCSLFSEVVTTDIEESYLDRARNLSSSHPNLSAKIDDVTNSALPESGFDLILCTEVIEHISDSTSALREMHRLLKPGGKLILSTPQRYSPLELTAKIAFLPGIIGLVRRVYREPILETGHINLMTAKQVTEQIEAAGFSIKKQFKSGMYIPLVAEFTGDQGLKLEKHLERLLRGGAFDWLLWTQYYVAEA